EPARVLAALLYLVERDLDHDLRPHVHNVSVATRLTLQEFRGLPFQHLIGETLESLAQHDESAAGRIARAQVEVREPSPAATAAPLCGEHDQVQRVGTLDLEPSDAAPARLVGAGERLRHDPFVSAAQSVVEEALRLLAIRRHDARN